MHHLSPQSFFPHQHGGRKGRSEGNMRSGSPKCQQRRNGESLTGALLLVAGSNLLPGALAGVALRSGPLAHPEAPLQAGVARLAAQVPVVPGAPVASTCPFWKWPRSKKREEAITQSGSAGSVTATWALKWTACTGGHFILDRSKVDTLCLTKRSVSDLGGLTHQDPCVTSERAQ